MLEGVAALKLKDCKTFKVKEYIWVNIAITVIFNLNFNHVHVYNRFSKTYYCKYLDV